MLRFNSLRNKNNEEFTRKAGIPYDCFMILLARIKNEISTTLLSNKLKRRGRKSSMIIEDKLLLTLYYLRHYPTFDNLGDLYNICSSYANDIYHEYLSMIIKTTHFIDTPNYQKVTTIAYFQKQTNETTKQSNKDR